MLVIGLTGGIGSGKSTVSNMLRELGAVIIDADVIARQVVRPGEPAWQELQERFGREIIRPDGSLDRRRLGEIAFHNSQALQDLNRITHPRIRERIIERIDQLRQMNVRVVVVDAPLLLEAGLTDIVDQVWVVDVDHETLVKRVQLREGFTAEQVEARLQAQMAPEEKRRRADVVIDNRGNVGQTQEQVLQLWHKITMME
ncbi:MAG TPA: dephospho-CoA kinase [Firmicutes bacterium]|jgi:dephospho-CoA kinase|nr:dephospho-CoA kinase [Bacillota bacterium]